MSTEKNINYYGGARQDMLRYIPESCNRILEIGCGQGRFGEHLVRMNKEVWGVEPHPEAAHIAESLLSKVLVGKVEEVIDKIPDQYFDLIVLNDVLEHLIDPWHILADLKRKLNHHGRVIASIPNFRYITNLFMLLIRKDLEYCDSGIMDSTHLRFFTMKSMQRLFLSNGYRIEKTEGIESTRSFSGLALATLINLFTLMRHRDIYFKQFVFIVY